jgi:hypothetical protein
MAIKIVKGKEALITEFPKYLEKINKKLNTEFVSEYETEFKYDLNRIRINLSIVRRQSGYPQMLHLFSGNDLLNYINVDTFWVSEPSGRGGVESLVLNYYFEKDKVEKATLITIDRFNVFIIMGDRKEAITNIKRLGIPLAEL